MIKESGLNQIKTWLNVLIAAKELYLSGHSKYMCKCVYDASGEDIRMLKILSYNEACTMFGASGKWWWKPFDKVF